MKLRLFYQACWEQTGINSTDRQDMYFKGKVAGLGELVMLPDAIKQAQEQQKKKTTGV